MASQKLFGAKGPRDSMHATPRGVAKGAVDYMTEGAFNSMVQCAFAAVVHLVCWTRDELRFLGRLFKQRPIIALSLPENIYIASRYSRSHFPSI